MTKNKKKEILFLLCLFFLLGSFNFVSGLTITYPRVPGAVPPQDFVGVAPPEQIVPLYALYILNLAIWLTGLIAFGAMVWAGILYLVSAGKPERILAARKQISDAFFGILLLLSSYIILQILNPQLTLLQISPLEPFEVSPAQLTVPKQDLSDYVTSIDAEMPVGRVLEDRLFATTTLERIKENAITTLEIAKTLVAFINSCSSVVELIEEQKKTTTELRLSREELDKLLRVKNYLPNECRLWTAQSLSEFLNKVNDFQKTGTLRQIKFWDNLTSIRLKDQSRDWATFYCPVGGTTFKEPPPPPPLFAPDPKIPNTDRVLGCSFEAPIGDIIDRAERTAYKLTGRMEELLQKSKELIDAVAHNDAGKIIEIVKEIEAIVTEENEENKEKIGILPLIDKKIASILFDWDKEVWRTMQLCLTHESGNVFYDTQRAIGAVDPKGVIIRTACESEPMFTDCQKLCYLEDDQNKYRECLNKCLAEKAQEFGIEEIGWCRNRLNFFCCNLKKANQ
jgi:hypothetical protein